MSESRALATVFVILTIPCLTVGCGSSPVAPASSSGDAGNSATPEFTITIASTGVNPHSLTVSPGSQVTFVNNDSRSHQMFSDPHPEHTNCPEINQVGFLAPGQRRQTGNLNTARTCGFHDHDRPADASLTGAIAIR